MGRRPALGRRQSGHHGAVLSRCHTIPAGTQSSPAPQSSIPGLGSGRFPPMLGVPHGRSLRVRLADSLRHFHGPRLAGTPGAERTALIDARTRFDPGADAFCPAAIRGGLWPSAADGLGRPAAPRGSLSDRLFAPPRGRSLLVGDQCRAAACQYQHSNVPCDLLVRHLPARRADALLWSAPERHDPEARAGQKLLAGPWAHRFPYTSPSSGDTGDIDFGPNARIELHETQLRWFDYYLKGIDTGILEEAPVKIFVMGENVWRDEQEWPLARTRYTPYYLRSRGQANSLNGDGRLELAGPAEEPPDRFVYDPDNPVPTCGGNTLIIPMGVQDQRQVETRQDVLVYTTVAVPAPLEVTGPIVVKLFASSSAVDTDFTAKLVDVRADGYARNLAEGIQRVRLEISSSNFPRFDRNLNTGEDQATGSRRQTAAQTILHDQRYPSHILLPVIPR